MSESRSSSELLRNRLERLALSAGLVLGAVIAVAIPAMVIWVAAHRADLPAVVDDDLAVARSDARDRVNGLERMQEVEARTDLPDPDRVRLRALDSGDALDPSWVRSVVARNAEAFAALEAALGAPLFQFPPPSSSSDAASDSHAPTLTQILPLVRLAAAEAQVRLAEGDPGSATDRAMLGVRVGKAVGDAEGAVFGQLLTAGSCQWIGLAAIEAIVRKASIEGAAARELVSRLESARLRDGAWQRVWATEYQHAKSSILRFDEELTAERSRVGWKRMPLRYLWQPNRTLAALAETYRERSCRAGLSCRDISAARPAVETSPLNLAQMLLSPNGIGNRLSTLNGPQDNGSADHGRCQLQTRFALVETLIAARTYWQANGELPRELADLVPEYLPALPEDRFAGAPLRYDPSRGVAYSVADDSDAGGESDELAISLVF
jgi:hypothetical protein